MPWNGQRAWPAAGRQSGIRITSLFLILRTAQSTASALRVPSISLGLLPSAPILVVNRCGCLRATCNGSASKAYQRRSVSARLSPLRPLQSRVPSRTEPACRILEHEYAPTSFICRKYISISPVNFSFTILSRRPIPTPASVM